MSKKSRLKELPNAAFLKEVRKAVEQLHAEGKLEIVGQRNGQPVYRYVERREPSKDLLR